MTPTEFELLTKEIFERELLNKFDQKIHIDHQKIFRKNGYNYKIDLSYSFTIAGIEYLNIIECKYWDTRIKRSMINSVQSVASDIKAHKAIIVTKRGFQKGAISFAKNFGIALVKISCDSKLEFASHFDGALKEYEKILETDDNLGSKKSLVGMAIPAKSIYDFISEHCGVELSKFLQSGDLNDYLDGWDEQLDPTIQEQARKLTPEIMNKYKTIECCGLPLILSNEAELRKVYMELALLKML